MNKPDGCRAFSRRDGSIRCHDCGLTWDKDESVPDDCRALGGERVSEPKVRNGGPVLSKSQRAEAYRRATQGE